MMGILFLFGFILLVLLLVGILRSAQNGAPPPSQHQPVAAKRQRRWVPAGESVIVGKREIGGMVYVDRAPNRYRGEFAHGLN